MVNQLFDIQGKVVVITGGAGVLCTAIAQALAGEGAKVAVLDLNDIAAESLASRIRLSGAEAIGVGSNVLEIASLESAALQVLAALDAQHLSLA